MGNLIKSELFKLRKDRSFRVLVGVLIGISLVMPLEYIFTENETVEFAENIFYLGHVLSINLEIVMRTIPCILAGFFISSEYSMGTMKSMVSSGNSRIKTYLSKLWVFSLGTIILSLILPFVMTLAGGLFAGSSALPEGNFFLKTVGIIALYGASFASIMMFFGIIFNDSGKTIGFLFFFFLLVGELLDYLGEKIPLFGVISENSPLNLLFNIFSLDQLNNNEIVSLIISPILTFIIFTTLGCLIFKKKEIK